MLEDGKVSENLWTRFRFAVIKTCRPSARSLTATEYDLRSQLEDARRDLERTRRELAEERTRAAILSSSLRVAQTEVEKLAEVVERDRKRVEAETASFARKIAESSSPV